MFTLFKYTKDAAPLSLLTHILGIVFNEELKLQKYIMKISAAFCIFYYFTEGSNELMVHVIIVTCYKLYMVIMCKNVMSDRIFIA